MEQVERVCNGVETVIELANLGGTASTRCGGGCVGGCGGEGEFDVSVNSRSQVG